ncbi:plasmid mobilization protein [Xanthomonas euvesicatoria]|uniref:plasmid mobilization protein n=3 Tax=Xanthomonas euvesicatoria TaxID=456327 RepID=UPI00062D622F|nr:plasmid mobilization relaxosome protein MobC [Xanthomonas euvesicatoria]KLA49993.1 mobilization protein [Xanthomonas euvesicatoria]KLA54497.1 mobilization protein [Xanthomonas euvesicatoria]KLA54999.1 mobilization protein [Xanthomonas euvesicatoria]KLA62846.1 mobilization protein [Xanthomonas euvesicatoria]KLA63766.1 mobilization protein [Xanthomonas euvesicatoria]
MARPRKPAGSRLGVPLAFRLPEDERAALLAKAGAAGMTPGEYIRRAVFSDRTEIVVKASSRDYDRLQYLVNKAGNNLNQLAHRANSDHLAGDVSEATYARLLASLEMLGRVLRSTLDEG